MSTTMFQALKTVSTIGKNCSCMLVATLAIMFSFSKLAAADNAPQNLPTCIRERTDIRLTVEDADPEQKAEGIYDGEIGWGDYLRLRLWRGEREIMNTTVTSTYGLWKGCFVEDRHGRVFLLLEIGRGRGTRARSTDLTIYVKESDAMLELGRVLVGLPVDVDVDLVYDYTIERLDRGGIGVTLKGRYDFFDEGEQTSIRSVHTPLSVGSMYLEFGKSDAAR